MPAPYPPRSAKSQLERDLTSVLLRGDPAGFLGYNPTPIASADVFTAWRNKRNQSPALQLYLHFAFCRMSCKFCQYFHVLTRDDGELDTYTDHLIFLLNRIKATLGRVAVSNGYFGGGTPTALTTPMLKRLGAAFRETFDVAHEMTTEAHPKTLDSSKIEALFELGINRVSMGIQSFDEAVLHNVGRTNGEALTLQRHIVEMQDHGMLVNVDLIVGLPEQSPASFATSLERTRALGADTITIYRYQPVFRLPSAPPKELSLGRALGPLLGRCLRDGYFPLGRVTDERYSALLLRATPRTLRYLSNNILSGVMGAFGEEKPRRYTDVDKTGLNLLGLGPGSISHLHGFGWYRDVTAVRSFSDQGATPHYWGTRLTDEEDALGHALIVLSSGGWLDLPSVVRSGGNSARVRALLEQGTRDKTLVRVRKWVHLSPTLSEMERTAFLQTLLPPRGDTAASAKAALAFKMNKNVQQELVDIDRAHRDHI